MSARPWTDDERAVLRAHRHRSRHWLAARLGRSPDAITWQRRVLGLGQSRNIPNARWTAWERGEIAALLQAGVPVARIPVAARDAGIQRSVQAIMRQVRLLGGAKRYRTQQNSDPARRLQEVTRRLGLSYQAPLVPHLRAGRLRGQRNAPTTPTQRTQWFIAESAVLAWLRDPVSWCLVHPTQIREPLWAATLQEAWDTAGGRWVPLKEARGALGVGVDVARMIASAGEAPARRERSIWWVWTGDYAIWRMIADWRVSAMGGRGPHRGPRPPWESTAPDYVPLEPLP